MPNVAMWGRALSVMPRITKEDWDGLDIVSRWLIATRSAVIVMTFTSAAFAGVLAYKAGAFDGLLFALRVDHFVQTPDQFDQRDDLPLTEFSGKGSHLIG